MPHCRGRQFGMGAGRQLGQRYFCTSNRADHGSPVSQTSQTRYLRVVHIINFNYASFSAIYSRCPAFYAVKTRSFSLGVSDGRSARQPVLAHSRMCVRAYAVRIHRYMISKNHENLTHLWLPRLVVFATGLAAIEILQSRNDGGSN